MKHQRVWIALIVIGAIAAVAGLALPRPQVFDVPGLGGASYLTTIKDSTGNFASRGVLTLHSDHSLAVTDSNQGGPTFNFSSQLGSWGPAAPHTILARTIDFDFPQSPGDVARLDYTIHVALDASQISGTVTLSTFPLESDPLRGEGTVAGTFNFVGELIKP